MTEEITADSIKVREWYEAVRMRPAMWIGGADSASLSRLTVDLMDCPERPEKITLTLSGRAIEIDSAAVAPSMRPRREGSPPFLRVLSAEWRRQY